MDDRERWLVIEGFIAGYVTAGKIPMRDKRTSDLARGWLNDCVADGVTVEMALTHEADKYQDWRSRIPWDMIDPQWVAVAKDKNGHINLFAAIPEKHFNEWLQSSMKTGDWEFVQGVKLVPDSVPWDESLAIRPGCEEGKQ